jgi:hypothetical protein
MSHVALKPQLADILQTLRTSTVVAYVLNELHDHSRALPRGRENVSIMHHHAKTRVRWWSRSNAVLRYSATVHLQVN